MHASFSYWSRLALILALAVSATACGGGGARRLTQGDGEGEADNPTVAPDGNWTGVAAFPGGTQQIWSFVLANSRWTQLSQTFERAYDPAPGEHVEECPE